jgi:hypothetical protein
MPKATAKPPSKNANFSLITTWHDIHTIRNARGKIESPH